MRGADTAVMRRYGRLIMRKVNVALAAHTIDDGGVRAEAHSLRARSAHAAGLRALDAR